MVNVEDLLLVIGTWSGSGSCTPDVEYVGSDCLHLYATDCP